MENLWDEYYEYILNFKYLLKYYFYQNYKRKDRIERK